MGFFFPITVILNLKYLYRVSEGRGAFAIKTQDTDINGR